MDYPLFLPKLPEKNEKERKTCSSCVRDFIYYFSRLGQWHL